MLEKESYSEMPMAKAMGIPMARKKMKELWRPAAYQAPAFPGPSELAGRRIRRS
jgi:hypothetical protein